MPMKHFVMMIDSRQKNEIWELMKTIRNYEEYFRSSQNTYKNLLKEEE
jgi:hypothetical protein